MNKKSLVGRVMRGIGGLALGAIVATTSLSGCKIRPDEDNIVEQEDMQERQVIIDAADRILQLQNTNGSWDWVVTGENGPTTNTYLNIAGVTGEVLIDAYKLTKDNKYLDGAKLTGDYLKSEIGVPSATQRQNAFNVIFLYNLNKVTDDASYKDEADAIINHVLYEDNYWTYNNGNHAQDDGIAGCTATELGDALKDYRGANIVPNGIIVYDLFHFIEAAKEAGETTFANNMGTVINDYLSQSDYDDTIDAYDLGLATGIMGLKNAGLNYDSVLTKLEDRQHADGSFTECPIQDTAYALMAFVKARAEDAKNKAAQYLVDNFKYNDGGVDYNGWLDAVDEYSEVTSEGGQALYDNHIK